MTTQERNLLLIEQAVDRLREDQREACNELAEHIQSCILRAGVPVGPYALALVGAREAARKD